MTNIFAIILDKIGAKKRLPDEMVREISNYLFHNIKLHGKHLQKTSEVTNFNSVMTHIPRLLFPYIGPRIIYSSCTNKKERYVKFVYVLYHKRVRRLIVELFFQKKYFESTPMHLKTAPDLFLCRYKTMSQSIPSINDRMRYLYFNNIIQTCLKR